MKDFHENNSELVVIHRTDSEDCGRIIDFLNKEGFNPVPLERPGSAGVSMGGRYGWPYIAVPREEKFGAERALKRYLDAQQQRVNKACTGIRKYITTGIIVCLSILIFALMDWPLEILSYIMLTGLVLFLVRVALKTPAKKNRN